MRRSEQSWIWEKIIVVLSMDVIDNGIISKIGLTDFNVTQLRPSLRFAIERTGFSADKSLSLWDLAIDDLQKKLGVGQSSAFVEWAEKFPCDPDSVLPELNAWERTWPDLGNALKTSVSAKSWGEDVASRYWQMIRHPIVEDMLTQRLTAPLTEWDKRCFGHYSNEDMIFEIEFFTVLTLGSERRELARFWGDVSAELDQHAKEVVWDLGKRVWASMHQPMDESAIRSMRGEYESEIEFEQAIAVIGHQKPPIDLPHPDTLLTYA
ncbi:hypothetical protein ACQZ61_18710 [Agrobacterium vitis]|uniref:hypothetical protein n=1 Tax=Agrobacterium vitis TaxID=373 RepID=UPI0015DB609E|nr:hypothetical protein [Agrobacterium vitis]MCF1451776.1 hypothetical protein [Agrobacterium vitis]BCH53202.1 hypothetical protein RvVAR031_08120 [Agrobacterium vitis]